MMPLLGLSFVQSTASTHPLDGTVARFVGVLPLLPLLGALLNGLIAVRARGRGENAATTARNPLVGTIGVGVMLASFALAVAIFVAMLQAPPLASPLVMTFGHWMPVGNLSIDWGIQLDQLSIIMTLVITGVGTLIHLFSIGYMQDDPSYARYFAYLNLFVAFMLVLVLGSSYPVMFVGWEGVGLCSYLLIGFWFNERANIEAGKKAFVVNRIGDFGFLVAMFMMWTAVQHLDFVGAHAALVPLAGTSVVIAIALFLFLGCTGKSAQLPLYMWLPDAMAGPTPVSALIHAATMVTAGVYLVARAAPIFSIALPVSLLIATVGALTALFAATIALRQWDIKKVLAYSTVSQLGYMFMAVGSGAYTAGVFHLVTHAFFKALLFLGAGSVIHSLHAAYHATHRHDDAQDLRNMGGLGRLMPVTAISMTIATLAIAGVPPFAGFFSKDEILSSIFERAHGSPLAQASMFGIPGTSVLYVVYGIGVVTAFITAIYMTRMMVIAFTGTHRSGNDVATAIHEAPAVMTIPVVALAVFSAIGGWINLPTLAPLGRTEWLAAWLAPVTGASAERLAGVAHGDASNEVLLLSIAIALAVAGIGVALWRYRRPLVAKEDAPAVQGFAGVLEHAYFVDAAVDSTVVRPLNGLSDIVLANGLELVVDRAFSGGGTLFTRLASLAGRRLQDGDVGKYAWLLVAGALGILAMLTLR